jgi:hypothetical protein
MTRVPLPVLFEPALVEEAVLRASVGRREARPFRHERDRLYAVDDMDERERAFQALSLSWFDRLQLGAPVFAALGELPLLAKHCARCVVSAAPRRREEGADLLVAVHGSVVDRTVAVRLRPIAFTAPDELLAFLRFELLHVSDMVDPAFGYVPELPDRGWESAPAQLLRDRYRAVWDVTVAGRLVRRGHAGEELRRAVYAGFSAAFPMHGDSVDAAFMRFFTADHPTHRELAACGADARASAGSRGLAPGARCPLCRCPTYAAEPDAAALPRAVIEQIRADFPTWEPAAGLCRQCADLYRARPRSVAAAHSLPGS